MCRTQEEGGRRCNNHHPAGRRLRNLQAKRQYWAKKNNLEQAENIANQMRLIRERYAELSATGATLQDHQLPLTDNAVRILDTLREAGFSPYVVGGSVRDSLLGLEPKDVDVEVYGGSTDDVIKALRQVGPVDEVGRAFGVLKITVGDEEFDVSLPRTDSKTDEGGHKGFDVTVDQTLSLYDATARRDFTLNALMYDHQVGAVIDEHGGLEDLNNGVLRHVSDAFDEDPLRVLRGIQFSSRFNMTIHPDTIEKSRTLSDQFNTLAKERIQTEFQKLFDKGSSHHTAFKMLTATDWAKHLPGVLDADQTALHRSLQRSSNLIQDGTIPKEKRAFLSMAVVASHLPDDKEAKETLSYLSVGDTQKHAAFTLSRIPLPARQGAPHLREWAATMPQGLTIRDWVILNRSTGSITAKKANELNRKAEKWGVLDGPEKPFVNGNELLAFTKTGKAGPWMRQTVTALRHAQNDRQFRTKEEGLVWVEKNKTRLFPADVLA